MCDFDHFSSVLSEIARPRPNHDLRSLQRTVDVLLRELNPHHTRVQKYPLHPHKQSLIGLFVVLFGGVHCVTNLILGCYPLVGLLAALAIPALLVLEIEFGFSLVSRLVEIEGTNLEVSFDADSEVEKELVFCAHFDSKTDPFDHLQRKKVYSRFTKAILLAIGISILAFLPFDCWSLPIIRLLRLCCGLLLQFSWLQTAYCLGGFVFLSKERSSPGVVDNATSVVTLLALVEEMRSGRVVPKKGTSVRFLFVSGEEVAFQGSSAWARERMMRSSDVPTIQQEVVINLELSAQSGSLYYAPVEQAILRKYFADPELLRSLDSSCVRVTGKKMAPLNGIMASDAISFARLGVPIITVGHDGESGLGFGGFHSVADSMDRFCPENFKQIVAFLADFIQTGTVGENGTRVSEDDDDCQI